MKTIKNKDLTVIDFFCGAGGFSEGFRQQGFKIILGVDNWEPAIRTFNFNFDLNCSAKNILKYQDTIDEIETLPDSDIIIGSPPCVTFSSSNNSGKADKTSGIILTETFLRIVAVKKWKPGSMLKAWFMENVSRSMKHLKDEYTFKDLGLSSWAVANGYKTSDIAILLKGNQHIINAANYGSPQSRERVISGEFIKQNMLIVPPVTHANDTTNCAKLIKWNTLKGIKGKLPRPNCAKSYRKIKDPNYPWLSICLNSLTDHFYDTGLFECEWRQSRFLKLNHPYMGRMAFPENDENPSRTITATKIGTSREAIIYRSENNRIGDGQYRTPTVREAACLMGFPVTYQFLGGETTKWRLIGNAVCPSVARAFASQVRKEYYMNEISVPLIHSRPFNIDINNLNNFKTKQFIEPPKRYEGSRFRRHPFKHGNITVTLSNYDILKNEKQISKWITSAQYGNGEGFPTYNFPDNFFKDLVPLIKQMKNGEMFLNMIDNGFSTKIANRSILQEMFERQRSINGLKEPTTLIEEVAHLIEDLEIGQEVFMQNGQIIFKNKQCVPVSQVFALYAINKISSIANQK